jgi:hypothetical protein
MKKCPYGYKPVILNENEVCLPILQPKRRHRYVCSAPYDGQEYFGYVDKDNNNNTCKFVDSEFNIVRSSNFDYLHHNYLHVWSNTLPIEDERIYPPNDNTKFLCRYKDDQTKEYYAGYATKKDPSCTFTGKFDIPVKTDINVEYLQNYEVEKQMTWVTPTDKYVQPNEVLVPCRYKNNIGYLYDDDVCRVYNGNSFIEVPIDTKNKNKNFQYLNTKIKKLVKEIPSKRGRVYNKNKFLCHSPNGPLIGEYDEQTKICTGLSLKLQ